MSLTINMVKEYNGYYDEEYFMFNGIKVNYREMLFTGFIGMGMNEEIYVDKHFMKLSDNAKQFVLLHEAGHIIAKHQGGFSYLIRRAFACSFGFVIKEEKIADRNALKDMSKEDIIDAINEVIDYTTNLNLFDPKNLKGMIKEFKSRIRLIKRTK